MSKIYFFEEDISFKPKHKGKIRTLLQELCFHEQIVMGDINIIFCSDEYLLKLNKEYLQHDYYTDIITFNTTENQNISGELFISVERIRENAEGLNIAMGKEVLRVILHGILHLCGYNDHEAEDIERIRAKEDFYLSRAASLGL
ncbi:MAG: rRNA maturation RNase YbeY [Bacteroidales bacterium]|nr:rRNA maturation RNase YbeY [Bacteroidales bacterium]